MASRNRNNRPVVTCSTCGRRMEAGERVKVQVSWEKQSRHEQVGSSAYVCRKCGEKFTHACGMDVPEPIWSLM